jgi:hypothetical protein
LADRGAPLTPCISAGAPHHPWNTALVQSELCGGRQTRRNCGGLAPAIFVLFSIALPARVGVSRAARLRAAPEADLPKSSDLFHAVSFHRLALIISLRYNNHMLCRHELVSLVKGSGDSA